MCHYYTRKYTLCGCIHDDISILCDLEYRVFCPGAGLIQVEYERGRCEDCRGTSLLLAGSYNGIENDKVVRSRSASAASLDSGGDTVSGGEEEERRSEDLEGPLDVKYVYCDASRVCDPIIVKRGSRRSLIQDKSMRE